LLVHLLIMTELGLVDYFVMGEAVGIVATFVMAFYYSRKQMQKLSVDIETKVLSDVAVSHQTGPTSYLIYILSHMFL
jgi:positive regulator of sigma E activity